MNAFHEQVPRLFLTLIRKNSQGLAIMFEEIAVVLYCGLPTRGKIVNAATY